MLSILFSKSSNSCQLSSYSPFQRTLNSTRPGWEDFLDLTTWWLTIASISHSSSPLMTTGGTAIPALAIKGFIRDTDMVGCTLSAEGRSNFTALRPITSITFIGPRNFGNNFCLSVMSYANIPDV